MADVLEPSPSGRAKCRGCGRVIAKGELRFGESLPNPFAEGEALYWFHVDCAALMRPEKFRAVLDAFPADVLERDWLVEKILAGAAHHRLPRIARVERATSGRARCRKCRELIPNGSFRIALQMFEEGRMSPIGTIHVACAQAYFGTKDILDRLTRLTPDLAEEETREVAQILRDAPPPPAEAEDAPGEARLAKTQPTEGLIGDDAETRARRA